MRYDGITGGHITEEQKIKISIANTKALVGNKNAKGHKLSIEKRKEISEKTKIGMKIWKEKKLMEQQK